MSGAAGTGACAAGNEGCTCFGNGTCNGSLSCLSNLCVAVSTGAAGTTGGTGTGGTTGGTGSGGSTSCSNADRNTLPIDSTGWVARECNNRNIQGAWYCFDDGINNTSCVDGQTPYRASSSAMCLSGTTTMDPTFAAYGAALALSLNQATSGGKSAYNATANAVTGFRVQITGNLGGNALRVGFTSSANPGTSPFVEVTAAGTHTITIASAMVPAGWGVPEAGQYANPASVFDIQFMLAGGSRASSYDFCITSVTPIVASTSGAAGTTGAAGGGGRGGTGGAAVTCSNTDLSTLPIDAGGRVALECNNRNIQGNWYCFDDNVNSTSCVDGQTPYRSSARGMCLTGTTTVDATFAAWGASLGLSLNQSTSGAEAAYNATANGVTGFRIQVTGNLGGNPLRVAFAGAANPGTSPFVEVTGTGSFDISIPSAMVPSGWTVPEAGQYANPANVWDIMFQIPGGSRASTYDFCITQVTPIGGGATGAGGTTGTAGTTGGGGTAGGTGGTGGTGGVGSCNVADDCNFGEACVDVINAGRRCRRFNCTNELGLYPCRTSATDPYFCWPGSPSPQCARECNVDGDCPAGTFCRYHSERGGAEPRSLEILLCRVPCATDEDCRNMVDIAGNTVPCSCQPPGSLNAGKCLHNVSPTGAGMTCMYLEQPPAN